MLLGSCQETRVKTDTRQVFNYNEMNGLSSLDPAAANNFENIWPVNQLFNGLLQMDDSLNVRPCIARSYSLSPDGRVYHFQLRNDVFFHDNACFPGGKGRRVTARDFVYSFNRLFDSRVSSAANLMDLVDRSTHGGFEARNDSSLSIYLKRPFSAFPGILTMKFFSVLPHEAVELYKTEFRRNPVGTGPFLFKFWDEGNRLVLLRHPHYFERDAQGKPLPYLDAVTVSFIRDRETAFMELLAGKFDMLSGADAFNTNEVLDKDANLRQAYASKFYLQKETFLKTDYIGILIDSTVPLVKQSPLKLRAVRQAMNYAFDRDKLVKYLRNNLGVAAHAGFLPRGLKSFDTAAHWGYHYNPAKAQQLLAEAGFPNGKGLPLMTIHTTENYKEQVEFIQSQLAANNIHVEVAVEKPSILRQAVNNCEYNLFKKSWFSDYADEENFMSLFYSKNFVPRGVNFFRYSNAEFDRRFEQAVEEKDQDKRIRLYREMDSLITADAPFMALYYDQSVRLVSHRIRGLGHNAMNLLNLKTVTKLPDKR